MAFQMMKRSSSRFGNASVKPRLYVLSALMALPLLHNTAWAAPGYGDSLTTSVGTVYNISTLAEPKATVNAANDGGVPATILIADGTYVLDIPLLHIMCDGLMIRSASGNRESVILRSPDDLVCSANGIIENCLFQFTNGWGYQYYTGGIDIHKGVNWIVRDNLFRNIRNSGSGIAEHAIHLWNRCPTQPQNVIIE